MDQLTAQQAKMAIEYFAAQAAEDAPAEGADTHMWMTRYAASIAIERQITEKDWDALVAVMSDYQSFDRDAEAFFHENAWSLDQDKDLFAEYLNDMISWKIDTAYTCSGA